MTSLQTYHMQPTGIAPEITKFNANMELFADPKASHYLLRPGTMSSRSSRRFCEPCCSCQALFSSPFAAFEGVRVSQGRRNC